MNFRLFSLFIGLLLLIGTQQLFSQNMIFTVGADTGAVGDTVFVPISVDGFINVSGYQGTVAWDSAVLDFIEITSPSSLSNIFGQPGQGVIPLDRATFSWIDFSGGSVTLPNGTDVIQLSFEIKATAPLGLTIVDMDSSVTTLAYLAGGVLFGPVNNAGSVLVNSTDMTFTVATETGSAGDTVTLPISVDNFTGIAGYQGTIRWDSAVLDFIDLNSPATGFNNIFGNPGQGLIPLDAATFTWLDFSGGTMNLPNGTDVIEVRFEIKSTASVGVSPVMVDGSVTTLAYSDGINLITPVVNQGSVTVIACTPTANPGFLFPTSVCQNGFNPQAIITGDLGGSFSADNGATINPVTGVLDLTTTVAGTNYLITYSVGTPCVAIDSQFIQILAPDDGSFLFVDTICIDAFNPQAIITGELGGTFSVDNGASIDNITGVLDLTSTSSNTTYLISYTTAGMCPAVFSLPVFVQAVDDASFTFPDTVCIGGSNPSAMVTGLAGGFFFVDNGASIDPNTGELFLGTTSPGTSYTISYQTSGICPIISSQSVAVTDLMDASFTYPSSVCPGGPNPLPTITGMSGGTFSVSSNATIDPATGELDLSSTVNGGLYIITYDLNDACQSFSQVQIDVEDALPPDTLNLPELVSECSATLSIPMTTDNCAGTVMGTTTDSLTYSLAGTYTVTWTFDDGNGNQTTSLQTVIVQDSTPPVAQCQALTVQLDSTGIAVITPDQIDNGSSDVCGIASMSLSQDTFGIADIGTQTVILMVMDSSGNSTSCEAMLTVEQTTSIEDILTLGWSLKAYPNPTEDLLYLEFDSPGYESVVVSLVNQLGQIVQKSTQDKHTDLLETSLQLKDLPSGMYIVQVEQASQILHTRVFRH